jgi:hypothetical protein
MDVCAAIVFLPIKLVQTGFVRPMRAALIFRRFLSAEFQTGCFTGWSRRVLGCRF